MLHVLKSEPAVVAAYLFGSEAAGKARPDSDVDIAVLLRPGSSHGPSDANLDVDLALSERLRAALRGRRVDVVVLDRAPLSLAFEAVKGELLFSRDDDGRRIVAEASIMSRYHDRVYYLRRHLERAQRDLAERGLA